MGVSVTMSSKLDGGGMGCAESTADEYGISSVGNYSLANFYCLLCKRYIFAFNAAPNKLLSSFLLCQSNRDLRSPAGSSVSMAPAAADLGWPALAG